MIGVPTPVSMRFDDLDEVDSVRVSTNLNRTVATVTDPQRIRDLVERLGELQDDWYVPDGAVRVLKLRIELSAGGRHRGSIGVGQRTLTAQRSGGFAQRDSTPQLRQELLQLLGVDDPQTAG